MRPFLLVELRLDDAANDVYGKLAAILRADAVVELPSSRTSFGLMQSLNFPPLAHPSG